MGLATQTATHRSSIAAIGTFAGKAARPLLAAAILILAVRAIRTTLADYQWPELLHYITSRPHGQVTIAIALTFAGSLIMTGYDTFAFRYIDHSLSYRRIALASFVSYAINNNVGLSGVVGTLLRYRFYSRWGVRAGEIGKVFLFCVVSYGLGFVLLGGTIFTLRPPVVPAAAHLTFLPIRLVGVILLIPGLFYILLAMLRQTPLRFRRWELALPAPPVLTGQLLIAIADWSVAGAVLYMLLPAAAPISYIHVLGIFLFAQMGGLLSNIPGGLGVFEAIALVFLTPYISPAQILGVLIAFRGVYFVLPLLAALLLLGSHLMTNPSYLRSSASSADERPVRR